MKNLLKQREYSLDGKYAWLCWTLCVSFTVWLHVIQTGYAIFNVQLQETLQISLKEVSFAAALYPCVAAVIQLFSGALTDKLGPRKTILPTIFISLAGVFTLSIVDNLFQLILAQFLLAIGAAFGFAGCGYVISQWFSPIRFGLIFGLVQVMVSFSAAFGQLGFNAALVYFHWSSIISSFVGFGVILTALSFLFLTLPKKPIQEKSSVSAILKDVLIKNLTIIKNRNVYMCCIHGGIVYGFIWALGVVWLPKLVLVHGMTLNIANMSSMALWSGVAVGSLVVDKVWKRIGSIRKSLLVYTFIQSFSIVGIVYSSLTPVSALVLSFFIGIGTSSHMIIYIVGKESVSLSDSGGAISIINAFMFLIGGLFLAMIGYAIDIVGETLQGYQQAATVFWVGLLFAFISLFFISEKKYTDQG